jgi:hypothetical protein
MGKYEEYAHANNGCRKGKKKKKEKERKKRNNFDK